jgi:hypothetical protein
MFPFKFLTAFCYQVLVCVCVSVCVCACVRECKLLKEWFSPLLCDRLLEFVIRFLLAKKVSNLCWLPEHPDWCCGRPMNEHKWNGPTQSGKSKGPFIADCNNIPCPHHGFQSLSSSSSSQSQGWEFPQRKWCLGNNEQEGEMFYGLASMALLTLVK